MLSWALECAEILKPPHLHLYHVFLQQRVIHADEMMVNVLASEKSKCFMWLYCTGTIRLRILLQCQALPFTIIMLVEQAPLQLNFCKVTQVICKSIAIKASYKLKQR
jgi:hypothetical protein